MNGALSCLRSSCCSRYPRSSRRFPATSRAMFPTAANAEGRFGSFWTTDLWIYHQGASTIHLWFNPAGGDNTEVESVVLALTDPVTVLEDVVGTTFGTTGVGSIHYLADGPVLVTSRTWTSAETAGSYGQTITGVPVSDAAVPDTGQAGALRMFVDQVDGFRTNLGLTNISGVPVTVEVEIFTSDGAAAPGNSSFSRQSPGLRHDPDQRPPGAADTRKP